MFFSHSFQRSDFTYDVTKDQNVEMFFDKGDFRRSDFTYGVTKDQNVESLFSEFFLVFDVLIFVVLTISQYSQSETTFFNANLKKFQTLKSNSFFLVIVELLCKGASFSFVYWLLS